MLKIHLEDDTIRLGCIYCDRNDHDGITPGVLAEMDAAGWDRIEEFDSSHGVLDWETHIGVCPDCIADGCNK